MSAADRQEVSLAEQLRISPDEVKATATRINLMLQVKEEGNVKEHIDRIFGEWETLARRLKKGGQMLDQAVEEKRVRDLSNLYAFLQAQLGMYDRFFKHTLSESHYRALKESILRTLDE